MNTIPLTFDEHQINRTVIGGKENFDSQALNMSVILLNTNGSHFKLHVFENLIKCNFKSIISIENDSQNFSIDDISKKFPQIKFIIPLEKATDGELINIAMAEVSSEYVLVIKDSLYIPSGVILPNLCEHLISSQIFCVAPRLLDNDKNGLPVCFMPGAEKKHFIVDSSSVIKDGKKTIYPMDNIGIYNRKKFISLGGFDHTIKSSYWQTLDLFVRAWLWGEETRLTTMLQFYYIEDYPIEDKTINIDYLRFFLKNELPKIKNETAYLKKSSIVKFYLKSSCGYFEARRLISSVKFWLTKNKYRFKQDLLSLVLNWDKENEN